MVFNIKKNIVLDVKKENDQIKCNKESWACDYYIDGYCSDNFDKICSENCFGTNDTHPCIKETGYCLNGCIKGTFDSNCSDNWNQTCLGESCERYTE